MPCTAATAVALRPTSGSCSTVAGTCCSARITTGSTRPRWPRWPPESRTRPIASRGVMGPDPKAEGPPKGPRRTVHGDSHERFSPSAGRPLRRQERLLLGRNQLRRPADRIEAAVIVCLVAAFLTAAVAAAGFAGHLYQSEHIAAESDSCSAEANNASHHASFILIRAFGGRHHGLRVLKEEHRQPRAQLWLAAGRLWRGAIALKLPGGPGGALAEVFAGGDAEFGEHVAQVPLDGAGADEQVGGDLLVGVPVAGQLGDLGFLGGEVGEGLDCAFAHRFAGG